MKKGITLTAALLASCLMGAAQAQRTSTLPGPQGVPDVPEPFGLDPQDLADGDLGPGWIPLVGEPTALAPQVLTRPFQPCANEPGYLDSVWTNDPWPGGNIYYEFDANMTTAMQNQALIAMFLLGGLENDLFFIPRTTQGNYLHFRDDVVNSSPLGYGGERIVRIFNWNTTAVIVHEILHSLGFYHEQSRPDRDFYVQIISGNIQSGKSFNFDKEGGAYYTGPYDFGSVMHYGQCDFTTCGSCIPGCETILTQPAYSAFQTTMGQRVAMSPLDVHGIHALYPLSFWRFVAWNPGAGSGTGLDPWKELASALTSAPSGARVFVMPGTYAGPATGTVAMTIEAPVGGVVMQ